jgi:N-acetylmuramoyl-L-alanine amidase
MEFLLIMRLLIILSLFFSQYVMADPVKITQIQLEANTPQTARLLFELETAVIYNVFTLDHPNRVVIDFKNTQLATRLLTLAANHPFLANIRSGPRNYRELRMVVDLKMPVHIKSFSTKSEKGQGQTLVIEMSMLARTLPISPTVTPVPATPQRPTGATLLPPSRQIYHKRPKDKRDIVIAIDAGHGGIDPGAVGKNGTHEKDVALAIANELAILMSQHVGFYPVLIRNGDYFLNLRKRIELAREYQADLFVSIHADAYPDGNAQGSSVYMLSQQGASSEAARWLAQKENAADLIGGISLSDKDDLLASVLLDLSQTSTLEASAHVSKEVLTALKNINSSHYPNVQQAAFMVLRSPDIPSILVETAFISNPLDETKLNDSSYQLQIATAIFQGVKAYFTKYAPKDTLLVQR